MMLVYGAWFGLLLLALALVWLLPRRPSLAPYIPILLAVGFSGLLIWHDTALRTAQNQLKLCENSQIDVDALLASINQPPPPPLLETKPASQQKNPILDVYGTGDIADDKRAAMDEIKQRYEEILVTYFYLRRCSMASTLDYHVIISALAQEMASVNAPGRLQYDVLTAAKGSYREMYLKTKCPADTNDALLLRYTDYINSISKNIFVP